MNADHADCWTRFEIRQQPETLRATQALLADHAKSIDAFLRPLLARRDHRIILAGAGTSAFIGEALAPWLSCVLGRSVEAIATTDLVSCPRLYLRHDTPTLMVSFGRSGNSPESVAAVAILDEYVVDATHLAITCNADGALARLRSDNVQVVVLPEATHDRGFAMTSSYSAMMLAALSIFTDIATFGVRVPAIAAATADALVQGEGFAGRLSQRDFVRVVYLGSGILQGLAREAALKLLELSDGGVASLFDTPMGFRHGPKTFVDAKTLVVVFLSNDPQTRRYDLDLVAELRRDAKAAAVVTLSGLPTEGEGLIIAGAEAMEDADLLFPYIVPAQQFALAVSERHGLTPDRPNAAGQVNRVVQGVRIHSLAA